MTIFQACILQRMNTKLCISYNDNWSSLVSSSLVCQREGDAMANPYLVVVKTHNIPWIQYMVSVKNTKHQIYMVVHRMHSMDYITVNL